MRPRRTRCGARCLQWRQTILLRGVVCGSNRKVTPPSSGLTITVRSPYPRRCEARRFRPRDRPPGPVIVWRPYNQRGGDGFKTSADFGKTASIPSCRDARKPPSPSHTPGSKFGLSLRPMMQVDVPRKVTTFFSPTFTPAAMHPNDLRSSDRWGCRVSRPSFGSHKPHILPQWIRTFCIGRHTVCECRE